MDDNPPPSDTEWRALYSAADAFKALAPWKWMNDNIRAGVCNPESGEVGYCCVMGAAGRLYGLAVYRGAEGYDCWRRLQTGEVSHNDPEMFGMQKCLIASFEDSRAAEKPDRAVMKRLGLKYRGQAAWPIFRSHLPNYIPWPVDASEARFLTVALQQSGDLFRRAEHDPSVLPAEEGILRVRKQEGGEWKDLREKAPTFARSLPALVLNEVQVARLTAKTPTPSGPWELHLSTFPGAIGEKGRPYFARTLIACDSASGFIHCAHVIAPWDLARELPEKLLGTLEQTPHFPSAIHMKSPELQHALAPVLSNLGVLVVLEKSLPAVEEALESLFDRIGGL